MSQPPETETTARERVDQPRLRHDPPEIPGYEIAVREAIPLNRLSYWSLISGLPWGLAFAGIGLLIQRPDEFEISISILTVLLGLIVLLIVVPVAHEAVHGAVAKLVGAKPFYGVGKGYAYTSFRDPVPPREYIAISIAPLVLLSIVSIAAFAVVPGWYIYIAIFATGNAAGAIGDLWIVQRVWGLPRDALIYDLANGYAAFVPKKPHPGNAGDW